MNQNVHSIADRSRNRISSVQLLLVPFMFVLMVTAGNAYELRLVNVAEYPLNNHLVTLDADKLPDRFEAGQIHSSVPIQADDLNGDGNMDELVLRVDLDARSSKTVVLRQGASDQSIPSSIEVDPGTFRFRNSKINCRMTTSHDRNGVRVIDRKTGKNYLKRLFFRRGTKHDRRIRVAASGPLRAVMEERFKQGGLDVTVRYVLPADRAELHMYMLFKNLKDEPNEINGTNQRDFVKGTLGELISDQIRDTDVVSVNWWKSARHNVLWNNTRHEHAVGFTMHSPKWHRFGFPQWGESRKTIDGLNIHASSRAGVEYRYTPRQWTISKNGTVNFGKIQDFAPGKTAFRRNLEGKTSTPTVKPGQSRRLGLSMYFYKGKRPEVEDQFSQDATSAPGVVNVYGEEDSRIIRVATEPYHMIEPFNDSDRWLADEAVDAEVRDGKAHISTSTPGTGIYTAMGRDFKDRTEIRGIIDTADNTAVKLMLEDLDSGEVYPLTTETGSFQYLFHRGSGLRRYALEHGFAGSGAAYGRQMENGKVQDFAIECDIFGQRHVALKVQLVPRDGSSSVSKPLKASIDRVALSWPRAWPPTIESPDPAFPLTDIAIAFRLFPETIEQTERGYRIQVARDPSFERIVDEINQFHDLRKKSRGRLAMDIMPDEVYPPGTYYCRARALSIAGPDSRWTEPRKFIIESDDHSRKPPVREISADTPLFSFQNADGGVETFWPKFPETIRKHSVTEIGNMDKLAELKSIGVTSIPRQGGHSVLGANNLPYIEKNLQKQSNLLGWRAGEGGFSRVYEKRYIRLAEKYGRYYGGGTRGAAFDRDMYQFLDDHSEHFFSIKKSQNPYSPLEGRFRAIGLWLAGRLNAWGQETEYHTPKKVMKPDEIRAIDNIRPTWLMGLAYGAQIYRVEAFSWDVPNWPHSVGWSAEHEQFGHLWTRAIKPFLTDLVKYDLIPTREDVLDRVRVAFRLTGKDGWDYSRGTRPFPWKIFYGVHGAPTHWHQWIPDNSRIHMAPLLPVHVGDEVKKHFEATPTLHDFDSLREAKSFVEKHYPARPKNGAFAVRTGDTGVIVHSEERMDGQQYWDSWGPEKVDLKPQPFHLTFNKGPVEHIEGKIERGPYIITKQYDDHLFVHANNYAGEQSTFSLHGDDRLSVKNVKPASAVVQKSVNENTLNLTLSHEHEAGAVRVFVE